MARKKQRASGAARRKWPKVPRRRLNEMTPQERARLREMKGSVGSPGPVALGGQANFTKPPLPCATCQRLGMDRRAEHAGCRACQVSAEKFRFPRCLSRHRYAYATARHWDRPIPDLEKAAPTRQKEQAPTGCHLQGLKFI